MTEAVIALPAAAGLALALILALLAIANMGREATNLAHVAEDDYQRQGANIGELIVAIVLGLALLGALGAGPLAGLVTLETLP